MPRSISKIGQVQLPADAVLELVDWELVAREYTDLPRKEEQPFVELANVLNGSWRQYQEGDDEEGTSAPPSDQKLLDRAHSYATRLDATTSSFPRGHAFVNGKHFQLDDVRDRKISYMSRRLLDFRASRRICNWR